MKKKLLICSILATAVTLAPCAFALEAPLEYVKGSGIQDGYYYYGQIDGWFSASPPAGNWKLPPFKSERPLFAFLNLGDRPHIMVLDADKSGGKSSTTLYVDCNGNGDLTDDRPIAGPPRGWKAFLSGRNNQFLTGPLDMNVTIDGVSVPYCLRLVLMGKPSGRNGSGPAFRWISHCQYRAVIAAGKKYTVLLTDANRNARFGDPTVSSPPINPSGALTPASDGDLICLNANDTFMQYERQPVGELLVLENKTYRMKIDTASRKLILTETGKGVAPLKLMMLPDRLTLLSLSDGRFVTVYRPTDAAILLPPGDYRLVSYQAFRKDARGNLWRLTAVAGASTPVTVAPGKNETLVFGEPYLPKAEIRVAGRSLFGGKGVSMNYRTEGQGKEIVTQVTFIKSSDFQPSAVIPSIGGRPVAPTYTIVKSTGELVAKGSFRYG